MDLFSGYDKGHPPLWPEGDLFDPSQLPRGFAKVRLVDGARAWVGEEGISLIGWDEYSRVFDQSVGRFPLNSSLGTDWSLCEPHERLTFEQLVDSLSSDHEEGGKYFLWDTLAPPPLRVSNARCAFVADLAERCMGQYWIVDLLHGELVESSIEYGVARKKL